METMVNILAIGGCVSLFVTPGALLAVVGLSRSCRKLEERNAAQGQTIAGLQTRLDRYERMDMPKSGQFGIARREVGSGVGGSTSTPPVGAVRPFSDEGGR